MGHNGHGDGDRAATAASAQVRSNSCLLRLAVPSIVLLWRFLFGWKLQVANLPFLAARIWFRFIRSLHLGIWGMTVQQLPAADADVSRFGCAAADQLHCSMAASAVFIFKMVS
ncbi:hypothetical protein E2562_026743 [Oryza meyeriana var. granulata]|uniref:Uncharacterized protein n=1 Tax=Oryza meyeriana var. granulata TaxID=110450 RepID=A0A6G1C828_9ORYZ|nr:hypothetical protein E2562_026743 [Oryza meyeriana var. granulata]